MKEYRNIIVWVVISLSITLFFVGSISFAEADTTKPTINSIVLESTDVEAPGTIEITADITDDMSGISYADITFSKKGSGQGGVSTTLVKKSDGQYHGTLNIGKYAVAGTYTFTQMQVKDNAGNSLYYCTNLEITDTPRDILNLKFNVHQTTGADTTKPTINSIVLESTDVEAPGTIGITADITDDMSGVSYADIDFAKKGSGQGGVGTTLVKKSDGKYHGTLNIGKYAVAGTYTFVQMQVKDNAGNSLYYCTNLEITDTPRDILNLKFNVHQMTEEVIKQVTCTDNGEIIYSCDSCSYSYSKIITAPGHSYGNWIVTKEATCTEEGSKERICSVCADKVIETIQAKGHSWNKVYTIDKKASCTENGSKSIHCSRCDETKNSTVIAATGHKFGDWEIITPSTCEDSGIRQHTCTNCGYSETEGMNPNGHDWEESFTIDVPATCTSDGSQSYHCKNCELIKDSEVIPSPGHQWKEEMTVDVPATCTTDGSKSYHCSVCDEKTAVEIIPATDHEWNSPTYKWTADYKSVTATRVCKNNPAHVETETVNTTSKVTRAATYTFKGQTTYTATFSNKAFSTQTKTVTNIPVLPKKAQPMTVKGKTVKVKYSKVKKKNQTLAVSKVLAVSNAQGTVTYAKVKGNKKITINKTTGKVTIKKKLKKGKYKVQIKVAAAGTTAYNSGSKTVTVTIRVK